jgi:hypothetical protein
MKFARSRSVFCSAVFALAAACAVYESAELSNEITQLRKHLPDEMVWMDYWSNEPWKRGYSASEVNVDVVEYVRPPETVKNWSELLTMRVEWRTSKPYTYSGGQTFAVVPDPLTVMEATRKSAQERCGEPVVFKKLAADPTGAYPSVTFYLACGKYANASTSLPSAEADVYRVFQGRHGVHVLIRARNASELDPGTLADWTEYMQRFYLCDNSVPGHECGKN